MSRIQEVRWVDRPIDEVFAYVADFATTEEYDPGVASARRLDDGPLGTGARFEVLAVFMGRELPMQYTITAYDPPHRVELHGDADTSTADDVIRFEEAGTGTRITWTLDLHLKGLSRVIEPFMGPFLRPVGTKALNGLAARLTQPGPLR